MFGKVIRWCLYIIFYQSDRFIFFMCLDQGVDFGCYKFYLYQMFVLVLVYYCVTFVNFLLNRFLEWYCGIYESHSIIPKTLCIGGWNKNEISVSSRASRPGINNAQFR
jgi:hypothetical protein